MPDRQIVERDAGVVGRYRLRNKSIYTGAPKMPSKIRPTWILGSEPKNGPHRRPQNRAVAWASPINEPALPCRSLCGEILSGAPAHRGSVNPTPGAPLAATPPLSRRFFPYPSISRRSPPVHAQSTPRAAASSPRSLPIASHPPRHHPPPQPCRQRRPRRG
jgi:hypothetical protein